MREVKVRPPARECERHYQLTTMIMDPEEKQDGVEAAPEVEEAEDIAAPETPADEE